jgi:hypothetical protein
MKRNLDKIRFDRKKVLSLAERNLTKEQMLEVLENEVFSDADFRRQLLEVSIKLNIPLDVVETVIIHFIQTASLQLIIMKKIFRRIIFIGFFRIEIQEVRYNKSSIYNKFKNNN